MLPVRVCGAGGAVSMIIGTGTMMPSPIRVSPEEREIVERVVQQVLEAEMTAHVGAGKYERAEKRRGHRNGYNAKGGTRGAEEACGDATVVGALGPRGACSTQMFSRYQRNEKARVLILMEMYVEGVSTRKVAEIMSPCAAHLSARVW